MTREQYLLMCEEMGWEPDEEEMPLEVQDLSYEAQQALRLFSSLPDKIEGMNGLWLGKDFSGLDTIMNIYGIEEYDRLEIFNLLHVCISEASKHYEQQRKSQESMAKARR